MNLSVFKNPQLIFDARLVALDRLQDRIAVSFGNTVKNDDKRFSSVIAKIEALSPLKCMARGYSVVYKKNKMINDIDDVNIGDQLKVRTYGGSLLCNVIDKE